MNVFEVMEVISPMDTFSKRKEGFRRNPEEDQNINFISKGQKKKKKRFEWHFRSLKRNFKKGKARCIVSDLVEGSSGIKELSVRFGNEVSSV